MTPPSRRSRRRARGGRGGAEPRARILDREDQIWQLTLRGATQREIRDQIGISQPAVSKALRRIEARLVREMGAHTDRAHARQVARAELVVREAWTGYERSQRDRTRRRQRQIGPGGATPAGHAPPQLLEVTVENQPGDPRFLRLILDALAFLQRDGRIAPAAGALVAAPRANLAALTDADWGVLTQLSAKMAGSAAAPTVAAPCRETPGQPEEDAPCADAA